VLNSILAQTGPLLSLWTMRFEGKHNYFAQLGHNIRNFKNICYSLAMRHQQYSSHQFKVNDLHQGLMTGTIISATLSQFNNSFDVIELLQFFDGFQDCNIDTIVYTANQIWYNGYNYRPNYVVYYDMGPVFPKLGVILDLIIISETRCLLVLGVLNVNYFDRHLYAYNVSIMHDNVHLIDVNNLVNYEAMELLQNCNLEGQFVISRAHI
jgi:hypothetical protein